MQTDVLLQYCGNSTMLALELLLSCTKTPIHFILENMQHNILLRYALMWFGIVNSHW